MSIIAALSMVIALAAGEAIGQSAKVIARASADSASFRIGDVIHIRIVMRHPAGSTFRPLLGDSVNGFWVLERQPMVQASDSVTTTGFAVSSYTPGRAVFPSVEFAAAIPGDTTRIILTNPIVVTIAAVAVDTTKDIRDLKPPLSIPLTLAEILLIAGIVLGVLAAGYFGYRYWKKRKERKVAGEEGTVPARPAHVIAFEQLALLKEKKLWQQGLIKQYYSEVTEIFRRYLENRYQLQAMEETSDEILSGLQKLRFPDGMVSEADKILRRADLVKFAKYQPGLSEHEEIYTVVHDFVDKTKIVQLAPVPQEELKVAADAGN